MRRRKKQEALLNFRVVKEVLEIVYLNKLRKQYTIYDGPQFDSKTMLEQKIVRYFE